MGTLTHSAVLYYTIVLLYTVGELCKDHLLCMFKKRSMINEIKTLFKKVNCYRFRFSANAIGEPPQDGKNEL